MRKSHPPPPHLVNGHFFTGGLRNLNGLLSNEFLSLYKCIPQPNDTWFGILDQSFAPAQRLVMMRTIHNKTGGILLQEEKKRALIPQASFAWYRFRLLHLLLMAGYDSEAIRMRLSE